MIIVIRMIVSGLIVGTITIVARRSPALGGWLAALPVMTLLSAFWLFLDKPDSAELVRFFVGVLWGIIPTVLMIAVVAICMHNNVSFFVALVIGVVVWLLYFLIAQRLGWFGL